MKSILITIFAAILFPGCKPSIITDSQVLDTTSDGYYLVSIAGRGSCTSMLERIRTFKRANDLARSMGAGTEFMHVCLEAGDDDGIKIEYASNRSINPSANQCNERNMEVIKRDPQTGRSPRIRDLPAIIKRRAGGKQIVLVGHSYGGWAAMQTAVNGSNLGLSIAALHTIDPISPRDCGVLEWAFAGPSCQKFPSDIDPAVVRSSTRTWVNHVQYEGRLHSEHSPGATNIDHTISQGDTGHSYVGCDTRVWRVVAESIGVNWVSDTTEHRDCEMTSHNPPDTFGTQAGGDCARGRLALLHFHDELLNGDSNNGDVGNNGGRNLLREGEYSSNTRGAYPEIISSVDDDGSDFKVAAYRDTTYRRKVADAKMRNRGSYYEGDMDDFGRYYIELIDSTSYYSHSGDPSNRIKYCYGTRGCAGNGENPPSNPGSATKPAEGTFQPSREGYCTSSVEHTGEDTLQINFSGVSNCRSMAASVKCEGAQCSGRLYAWNGAQWVDSGPYVIEQVAEYSYSYDGVQYMFGR